MFYNNFLNRFIASGAGDFSPPCEIRPREKSPNPDFPGLSSLRAPVHKL
jgi:hypothetical protein